MKILITGPQGSGKTTQGQILALRYQICLIDTGELIRDRAQVGDEVGRKLQQDMAKGELVDPTVAAKLIEDKINSSDCQKGYIIDGYPRSLEQLKAFDPHYDFAIYLDVPDEVVMDRMEKRGRADDNPEAIKRRLQIYHQITAWVLDHYSKEGKLIKVDGQGTPEQVTERILERL